MIAVHLYLAARLRGLAVRLRLREPRGPGPRHPESTTVLLDPADEDWLAQLDAELWPADAEDGCLGADYTTEHDPDGL